MMSRPTEPAAGGIEACLGNRLSHVDIPSEMTLVEITMAVITALQSFPWHRNQLCNENGISLGKSPRKRWAFEIK